MTFYKDKILCDTAHLSDAEFRVLYFILNTISMSIRQGKGNRVKIYRDVLADLVNKSSRTISRLTDQLNKLGMIKKDVVSDGSKRYDFYSSLVTNNDTKLGHEKQETDENLVTDDTFNKTNKINKKNKLEKINKTKELKEHTEWKEETLELTELNTKAVCTKEYNDGLPF